MPVTVRYFSGLASGLGAFDTVSLYLGQTMRFSDDDLTSANASTVVSVPEADTPALPREGFVVQWVSGEGFIRPRPIANGPLSAAAVLRGVPISEASPVVELQIPKGWTLDIVAAA